MAFDGSGNFNRTYTWTADAAAGTKILASRHDTHDQDLANGLSNTIAKDGQSSPTADIPFNAKKITNLADPVNDQDAVTKKYMLGTAATQGLFTKLGFASADMSLLGRAAGSPAGTLQRIAYNDKADGTGNDVFVVNDDGTVSARAADGTYKLYAPATAETRSRVVNGAMQISQENGDSVIASGGYAADQWLAGWGFSPGTLTVRRNRYSDTQSDYLSNTVGTGNPALAAGDYHQIFTKLEGIRIRDFMWGGASAKQAVLRFKAWANAAGTYTAYVSNGANDRCFLAPFTVLASTWTNIAIVVPGDTTTGAWPGDNTMGMQVGFSFGTGTTYQGVAGWQAGFKLSLATATNGLATAGNELRISDVGLYLDPGATGLAPRWTMPDEAEELQACMRYYEKQVSVLIFSTANATQRSWAAVKRIDPAVALVSSGGGTGATYTATATNGWFQGGANTLVTQGSLVGNARM